MRKLPLFLLLATSGLSVAAQAQDGREGRRHRAEAAEDSDNRRERAGRRSDEERGERPARAEPAGQSPGAAGQSSSRESAGEKSGGFLRGGGPSSWQPRQRQVRTIPDTQPAVGSQAGSSGDRSFEGRPRRDYRDGKYARWSRNWHHDSRYDWRRWRDRNRSSFRLGFYYDPFGWSYRRWSIGSFLFPSYYQSRYWLHDPWHYRLPPAYGPYRWVRYWDDAVLVDTYTGEVVDVIHNFFW